MSMSPGRRVRSPRSMTTASAGTEVGATSMIRSSWISSSAGSTKSPRHDVDEPRAAQERRAASVDGCARGSSLADVAAVQTAGSRTASKVDAPLSGTRG